jgi:hypothetical protein
MKARKKYLLHLFISLLSFAGLLLLVNTFDPKHLFEISVVKVPIIIPFFFLLFLTLGGAAVYLLANVRRGILAGIFVVGFLLLQYLHVNNIFYIALLLLIVTLIEFLFWKKK